MARTWQIIQATVAKRAPSLRDLLPKWDHSRKMTVADMLAFARARFGGVGTWESE